MMKRIPHNTPAISGELKTQAYVQHHRKYASLQFKSFLREMEDPFVEQGGIAKYDSVSCEKGSAK